MFDRGYDGGLVPGFGKEFDEIHHAGGNMILPLLARKPSVSSVA